HRQRLAEQAHRLLVEPRRVAGATAPAAEAGAGAGGGGRRQTHTPPRRLPLGGQSGERGGEPADQGDVEEVVGRATYLDHRHVVGTDLDTDLVVCRGGVAHRTERSSLTAIVVDWDLRSPPMDMLERDDGVRIAYTVHN